MQTQNLWANKNLYNGQVGTVKDFLYPVGKNQPSIPVAVIIDFPDYKGPPFFTNPGQETWVPIMARTHTWGKFRNKFRTQIPITLGWGWTFWKVQGSTFVCPVVCHLGDKEVEHGLTFVGVSRAKTIAMLAVPQGVFYIFPPFAPFISFSFYIILYILYMLFGWAIIFLIYTLIL